MSLKRPCNGVGLPGGDNLAYVSGKQADLLKSLPVQLRYWPLLSLTNMPRTTITKHNLMAVQWNCDCFKVSNYFGYLLCSHTIQWEPLAKFESPFFNA
jgi:hypothetical protein